MNLEREAMENLVKIIDLKTQEVQQWRDLISKHADGEEHLKEFEKLFGDTKEKFERYRELMSKNGETADILENQLNKALLERSKTVDSLNKEIQNLKRSIENQTTTNELLERKRKETVGQLKNKLKYTLDHSSPNKGNSLTDTGVIQRLMNDLKCDDKLR